MIEHPPHPAAHTLPSCMRVIEAYLYPFLQDGGLCVSYHTGRDMYVKKQSDIEGRVFFVEAEDKPEGIVQYTVPTLSTVSVQCQFMIFN